MPAPPDDPPDIARAREAAEKKIQRIMLDLAEATGRKIDHVTVDTRNFANYGVEIFWT